MADDGIYKDDRNINTDSRDPYGTNNRPTPQFAFDIRNFITDQDNLPTNFWSQFPDDPSNETPTTGGSETPTTGGNETPTTGGGGSSDGTPIIQIDYFDEWGNHHTNGTINPSNQEVDSNGRPNPHYTRTNVIDNNSGSVINSEQDNEPDFINNNSSSVIDDNFTPVMDDNFTPVMDNNSSPIINNPAPIINNPAPIINNPTPVINNMDNSAPVMDNPTPVINSINSMNNVDSIDFMDNWLDTPGATSIIPDISVSQPVIRTPPINNPTRGIGSLQRRQGSGNFTF